MGKNRGSYANVVRGGTHNLRRQGGSMSSNSGGSHGSTDTRNNRRDRDREQGSSSHQQSGQPQAGSSNSDPRPSTLGGFQGNTDTGNKPDENVSNIFYWSYNDFRSVGTNCLAFLSEIVGSTFGKFVAIFFAKFRPNCPPPAYLNSYDRIEEIPF